MPEELNDRAQDNWRPLIAIADAMSKDIGERARAAAKAIDAEAVVSRMTTPRSSLSPMSMTSSRKAGEGGGGREGRRGAPERGHRQRARRASRTGPGRPGARGPATAASR